MKPKDPLGGRVLVKVALHTSAWIETTWAVALSLWLVALHTSAWIETFEQLEKQLEVMSHSIRVRGLKHHYTRQFNLIVIVALHTSAWIETNQSSLMVKQVFVALHTSAWIETKIDFFNRVGKKRRTPYKCVD